MSQFDPPSPSVSQRLVSLDVLRGFDMFWILGMEEVAMEIGKASNAPWAKFILEQLDHAKWAGFHFLDLIFPLFVFISGVSLVFSADKTVAVRGRSGTVRKMAVRAFILYLLGLFTYGLFSKGMGIRSAGWASCSASPSAASPAASRICIWDENPALY